MTINNSMDLPCLYSSNNIKLYHTLLLLYLLVSLYQSLKILHIPSDRRSAKCNKNVFRFCVKKKVEIYAMSTLRIKRRARSIMRTAVHASPVHVLPVDSQTTGTNRHLSAKVRIYVECALPFRTSVDNR